MSDQEKVVEAETTPEVEPSGTQALQKGLQSALLKQGLRVSRNTAWKVFKDFIATAMVTTLDECDMRLPLSGVGTFEIQVLELRKTHLSSKEGEEPRGKELTHNKTVKFSFKPSSKLVTYLEQNIEGVLKEDPKPEDLVYPFTPDPAPKEVKPKAETPAQSPNSAVDKPAKESKAKVAKPAAVKVPVPASAIEDF